MAGCAFIAITVFNYNNQGSVLKTKTMGSRSVPYDFTLLRLASETTNNDHTKAESKRSFEDNAANTTLSDDLSKTSYTGSISVNSSGVIYPDGHRCDNCLQGKLLVAINKGKPSLPLSVIKYRYMHQTSSGDNSYFYKFYRLASINSLSMIFQHRVWGPVRSQMWESTLHERKSLVMLFSVQLGTFYVPVASVPGTYLVCLKSKHQGHEWHCWTKHTIRLGNG